MCLEFWNTLWILRIDTGIEQTSASAWKRDDHNNVDSREYQITNSLKSELGGKIILNGDVNDSAIVGEWIVSVEV